MAEATGGGRARVFLDSRRTPVKSQPVDSAPAHVAPPTFPRFELHDLFNIARWQHEVPWEPLQPGVDIHRLYGDGREGPTDRKSVV